MVARGDAHPNSRSSWGHEIDVESQTIWKPTEVISKESIDMDRYEHLQDGEVRAYLVATKKGVWVNTGLAPSRDKLAGLYATADGAWAVELVIWPDDGDELPYAISKRVEELSAVPQDSARRWAEIIEEVHE